MTTDKRDMKYSHLLQKNVRVHFGDLNLNSTYVYHIPYIHKQFDKQYDENKVLLTNTTRPKWYVDFLGYYDKDIEARDEGSEAPYLIKGNQLMRQGFSGYGFFSFFEFCNDKFDINELGDNDGVTIMFRRGLKPTKWFMTKITLLKEKDYPAFAKGGAK